MTDATGGTYTLIVDLPVDTPLEIGALGEHALPAGWYAYTGSALGAGGFARVDRHHDLADGKRDVRHWHVDYLLGHPETRLASDMRSLDADIECAVARRLPDGPVDGFGASDCDCGSHLAYAADREELLRAVRLAHTAASR